jgi:hypothetical protein|tara:strand:+ start:1440 stop:1775 length:336 start_codon:yes stop_codon:yes gene_type:complete
MGANQTWAKVIGIIFLLVGILGFILGGSVFGFTVNTLHNIVHLLTGAVWAWAGFAAGAPVKKVNTHLGGIYLVVFLLGIIGLLGFLNVNGADNVLHLVVGGVSLYLGLKKD